MLIIIRGLPGSGKSTLAHAIQLSRMSEAPAIFEADDYFINESGAYVFDGTKLREAHESCQTRTREWLEQGRTAIVSNTFTQRWEYQPYISMAKMLNMPVQVIEVHGDFQNIHGVPPEKIESMRNRWEPHV